MRITGTLMVALSVLAFTTSVQAVNYDFNDGLVPAGTSVHGSAQVTATGGVGDSGVLRITENLNGQLGAFFIPEINSGNPVSAFEVTYKQRIGGGTCCDGGTRTADGMSFSFGSDVAAGIFSTAEDGTGSGIRVTFDTWDSGGADTAPAIDVVVGGTVVASQSMDGIRSGGRAPAGPFINDPATGQPMTLFTGDDFANVLIRLNTNNTLDVMYKDVLIFDGISVAGYVPQAGNFAFGARTGGANDNHFVDDLNVRIIPEPATFALGVFGLGGLAMRRRRSA